MTLKISFIPVRSDETLEAEWDGSSLILNRVAVNLSDHLAALEQSQDDDDDASAPLSPWILNEASKVGDTINITLLLPYGSSTSADHSASRPIEVTEKGPIKLPL